MPTKVSKDGGGAPIWDSESRELYFLSRDNHLMSVPVTMSGGTFKAGTAVPLFQINATRRPGMQVTVADDYPYVPMGDRFLVTENEADLRNSTINLVLNWISPRPR